MFLYFFDTMNNQEENVNMVFIFSGMIPMGNLDMSTNELTPCLLTYRYPNPNNAIPEQIPIRRMIESNKSSCHFRLDIQWLYRILENVTEV